MYRVSLEEDNISYEKIVEELENNAFSSNLIKNKIYERDEMIYAGNNGRTQVLYLSEGHMGTFVNMGREGQRIVDFHKEKALIGFEGLFLMNNHDSLYHYSFNQCRVQIIDGEFLLDYLSIRPAFMEYLTKLMAEKFYHLAIKECSKGKYQRDKVIIGLYEAARKLGAEGEHIYQFPNGITNITLANYCRIDSTSFSKICKNLLSENFILDKKKMVINLEKMQFFLETTKNIYI